MKKILLTVVLGVTVVAVGQNTVPPAQGQPATPPAQGQAAAPAAGQAAAPAAGQAAAPAAAPQASQPAAAPAQGPVIKDPAEYNAYVAAIQQKDANAKISGLEAFVTQYPNSVIDRKSVV